MTRMKYITAMLIILAVLLSLAFMSQVVPFLLGTDLFEGVLWIMGVVVALIGIDLTHYYIKNKR